MLEARIAKLRTRLHDAVVVEHDTDEHVGAGSIVEIVDEHGEAMEVTISAVGGVSPDSPLGPVAHGRGGRRRRRGRGAARLLDGHRALDPALAPSGDRTRRQVTLARTATQMPSSP